MSSPEALLSLLSDPDPQVTGALVLQLRDNSELLAEVWELARGCEELPVPLIHAALAHDAQGLVAAFGQLTDIEDGIWLLPTLYRPRTDWATAGKARLDALAESLPTVDPSGIALHLGRELGFTGSRLDYYQPANSYMPLVLERRAGLPISLTTLWMLLCRRRGYQAHALALPGHVIGAWDGGWIDLFAGGQAIDEPAIETLCLASGVVDYKPHLQPASGRTLLARMARNLEYAYRLIGDLQRSSIAHQIAKTVLDQE